MSLIHTSKPFLQIIERADFLYIETDNLDSLIFQIINYVLKGYDRLEYVNHTYSHLTVRFGVKLYKSNQPMKAVDK